LTGWGNGRDEGVTKLRFADSPEARGHGHGKILGCGMVGIHAGDSKMIHPHPTLGEGIGMAAEITHGSCTDVPPARK